jgi:sigma-B regulation protein RsbU (phosphoserine phosphatase)
VADRSSRGDVSSEDALNEFYAALLDDDAAALYDRAPCGYLSTTPDGTIIKVNQTFLSWTGYRRSDLVGRKRFVELLTAGGRIYHETHYAPMLQMQGIARQIALDITRADGGRLPALVNAVLERDELGGPLVVRTAIFDATERRGYEQELLRATRRAEESAAHATLLARTLQQTLIPPAPPDIPGLDVAAGYRPAGLGEEVGGDFYDVFEIGPGDCMVAIGDVRGKGVDAAVVTAQARHTIRAAAVRQPFPRDVLHLLNDELLRHETDRFCTGALMRLRHLDGSWTATVSSGGHPLPLLCRDGGSPVAIGQPGSLLGLFETDDFHDSHVVLQPGDAVILYTDGVTEGRSGRDFFGEDRLCAAIVAYSASAGGLIDGILSEVLEFQSGHANDDIAVVAVRVPIPG